MMSQAYFKGKRELLEWISDVLDMDVPKVETLASGAHYSQLLDACHPGSIKMSKVNYAARTEDQFVQNWKLVQIAFEKKGIQKLIPVQRLIKARFQDNLEFLQWFHQYFQTTYRDTGAYDPQARRKKCKGANMVKSRGGGGSRTGGTSKSSRPTYGSKRTRASDAPSARRQTTGSAPTANLGSSRQNAELEKQNNELLAKNALVEKELARISKTAQLIENERDFYFKILLKVETMCKESPTPDHPCIKRIIKVLYTSSEDPSPRDAEPAEKMTGTNEAAAAHAASGEFPKPEPMAGQADKENLLVSEAGTTLVDDANPNFPAVDPALEASIDLSKGEPLVEIPLT